MENDSNISSESTLKSNSNFGENSIIDKYLAQFLNLDYFCVDIAASDRLTMSNTFHLFKKGYSGIAVEYDSKKFLN